MKMSSGSGLVVAAFVGCNLLLSGAVEARSVSAHKGVSPNVAEQACLAGDGWYESNICSTAVSWHLPLVADTGGAKTITIAANAFNAGEILCRAYSRSPTGTTVTYSNVATYSATHTWSTLSMTGVVLTNSAALGVACNLAPGAVLGAVNWNQ